MAIKYNLPEAAYLPGGLSILKKASEADARKEYQRLRRAAEKRLNRLRNSEFSDIDILQYRKNGFKPVSQIKSMAQLGSALSDVKGFLDSRRTSITGLRRIQKETIATLHKNGYTFVTKDNLKAFGDFMEAARLKAQGKKLLASDRVAEMYEAAERKKIPPEQLLKDFDYWRKNVEALNDSRMSRKENATAADYKRNIENRRRRAAKKKAQSEE